MTDAIIFIGLELLKKIINFIFEKLVEFYGKITLKDVRKIVKLKRLFSNEVLKEKPDIYKIKEIYNDLKNVININKLKDEISVIDFMTNEIQKIEYYNCSNKNMMTKTGNNRGLIKPIAKKAPAKPVIKKAPAKKTVVPLPSPKKNR